MTVSGEFFDLGDDVFINSGPYEGVTGVLSAVNPETGWVGVIPHKAQDYRIWVDIQQLDHLPEDFEFIEDEDETPEVEALTVKDFAEEDDETSYNLIWPNEKPGVRVVVIDGPYRSEVGVIVGTNEKLSEQFEEEVFNIQLEDGRLKPIAKRLVESSVYQGEEL